MPGAAVPASGGVSVPELRDAGLATAARDSRRPGGSTRSSLPAHPRLAMIILGIYNMFVGLRTGKRADVRFVL